MDTSRLANIAEDLVAHRLQQAHIFVAKPKFDLKGTDLLAFTQMDDGVKFCRIQSKGRTLAEGTSSIEIDEHYVSRGFLVFLYLDSTQYDDDLYCFFAHDIEAWNKGPSGKYTLSISKGNYREKLSPHRFNSLKVDLIRVLIAQAEVKGEFSYLSVLSGTAAVGDVVASGGFIGHLPQ